MTDICLMLEGQEDLTWERFFRFVDAAEQLGYDGLFRSDHLTSLDGNPGKESLALWPSLTALAQRTTRIRFGPMVCSITFRHPAILAKMAASVDVLSNGRLDLGIGAGWNPHEHEMFGIPYPRYRDRLDRLDEGATVIEALWSGHPRTTTGPRYPLIDAESHPSPVNKQPKLIMGGKGSQTLKVVAKHATEWNFSYSTLELFVEKSAELDRACDDIGRNPEEVTRSMMLPFAIGRNTADLQTHIDAHRAAFSDLPSNSDGWREAGFIVGTSNEVVDQIGQRREAGATRFMLQQNALDDLNSVELVASEVIPQL